MANDNPYPVNRPQGGTLDDTSRPDGVGKAERGPDQHVAPARQYPD